jgi:hypothetical protein
VEIFPHRPIVLELSAIDFLISMYLTLNTAIIIPL